MASVAFWNRGSCRRGREKLLGLQEEEEAGHCLHSVVVRAVKERLPGRLKASRQVPVL